MSSQFMKIINFKYLNNRQFFVFLIKNTITGAFETFVRGTFEALPRISASSISRPCLLFIPCATPGRRRPLPHFDRADHARI